MPEGFFTMAYNFKYKLTECMFVCIIFHNNWQKLMLLSLRILTPGQCWLNAGKDWFMLPLGLRCRADVGLVYCVLFLTIAWSRMAYQRISGQHRDADPG